ncbi:MAG: hypothetical protein QM586_07580, partial [Xenophilus sp.]
MEQRKKTDTVRVLRMLAACTGAFGLDAGAEPIALSNAPAACAAATSLAVNSRSAQQDAALFSTGYHAGGWTGYVRRDEVPDSASSRWKWGVATDPGAGAPRPRTTADIMDAQPPDWPGRRVVLSYQAGTGGISWEWSQLSQTHKAALQSPGGMPDTGVDAEETARQRLAWLRGDRRREAGATPGGPLR